MALLTGDGRWKGIWNVERDTFELFDLNRDPGELQNLVGVQPDQVKLMWDYAKTGTAAAPGRSFTIQIGRKRSLTKISSPGRTGLHRKLEGSSREFRYFGGFVPGTCVGKRRSRASPPLHAVRSAQSYAPGEPSCACPRARKTQSNQYKRMTRKKILLGSGFFRERVLLVSSGVARGGGWAGWVRGRICGASDMVAKWQASSTSDGGQARELKPDQLTNHPSA